MSKLFNKIFLYIIFIFFLTFLYYYQYPTWLEEKRSSLGAEELGRYERQLSLVSEVCSEYEAERSSDSDEIKKKRLEKLLGLMQKVSHVQSNLHVRPLVVGDQLP